jgi:hypothetical protein
MSRVASGSKDPWEDVKPILERLWLTEGWKLDLIVQEMRTKYNFHRVCVTHIPFRHPWESLRADEPSMQRAPIQDPIWEMGVV